MNNLLIAVILIFAISAIIGYRRGFVGAVASLSATIISIILVVFLTPYVSAFLLKVIPIEERAQEKCLEMILPGEEGIEVSREEQMSLIENANLPKVFKQLLNENNNEEIYKVLGVTKFSDYVGSYIAKLIANVAAALLIFIVAIIVIRLLLHTSGILNKLPMIGSINRLAGGIFGLGVGLVAVWVLFVVLTLMYDTSLGRACFACIEESAFLEGLYSNNLLMNFILNFKK